MPDRDRDLIDVIDRTALIENLLNQVIEAYCAPRQDRFGFFWDVVLDSSIMPLGSKMRVAMAAAQALDFKLDGNALHKVVALRNAFAHHQTNAHPVVRVGKTEEEDESHYQIQVISGSGRITRTNRRDAFAEFQIAYEAARASLGALLERVKDEVVLGAAPPNPPL